MALVGQVLGDSVLPLFDKKADGKIGCRGERANEMVAADSPAAANWTGNLREELKDGWARRHKVWLGPASICG